jgi:hypothetical protein
MHASYGAHKIVLGRGMVKVGHGIEQVHAYLMMLEFDSAVRCNITHCLEVMWISSNNLFTLSRALTLIASARSSLISPLSILERMSSMMTGLDLPFTNTLY